MQRFFKNSRNRKKRFKKTKIRNVKKKLNFFKNNKNYSKRYKQKKYNHYITDDRT